MQKKTVLIVDDEADIRSLIKGILEDEGYDILLAGSSSECFQSIAEKRPDLIILDIWLQGSEHDGLEILELVKAKDPYLPIIMISGHGTIETAVSAIKQGAYDFIEKPFKSDRLLLMIQRGLEAAELKRENAALKRQYSTSMDLIGNSGFIKNLKETLERVAPSNSRVLLTGEPGTGKEILAQWIHTHSSRAEKPFLILNCATLQADRFEEELFGKDDVPGVLENAHEGTLLLDEVSDMHYETQGKIVRVLQENRFQRLGSEQKYEVDVRILASSNRDLSKAIEDGVFREDLYYRLNVVPIEVLPLRSRIQDLEALSQYFLGQLCHSAGVKSKALSASALGFMRDYAWPGNVRQLHNVLEWMVIMHGGSVDEVFEKNHLPSEITGEDSSSAGVAVFPEKPMLANSMLDLPLREAREAFERDYLFSQVERFDGNISKTAQFIGMERSALHRKLKSLQPEDEAVVESIQKQSRA